MRLNPLNIHILNLGGGEAKLPFKTVRSRTRTLLPFCLGILMTLILVVLVCLIGGKLTSPH
jgi:hypothetical protein